MKRIFDSKEEAVNRESVYYWMNKYISLLEKYNELLLQLAAKDGLREDIAKRDFEENNPSA